MSDMSCGGVQVSLLNFLKHLQQYDIDITLLFDSPTGSWFERLPKTVKVKSIPYKCEAHHKLLIPSRKVNLFQNIKYHVLVHWIDDIIPIREERNKRYTFLLNNMTDISEEYDIAIDYHGYGFFTTSVLINKVYAKFKAVFIHDEKLDGLWAVKCDLKKIDAFYSVSYACKSLFEKEYPELSNKSYYFPNYMNIEDILGKAKEPCQIEKKVGKLLLVTVGRMEWQKGYDLAVEIAEKLDKHGVDYEWYCLGDGSQKQMIQKLIYQKRLQTKMILVGKVDNPYPYIKTADLYVQPSRHEGFGLAVAEALILKRIVVATELECISEQIENGKNGILVPWDADAFCNVILRLVHDEALRDSIMKNIKEDDGNDDSYIKMIFEHCEMSKNNEQ